MRDGVGTRQLSARRQTMNANMLWGGAAISIVLVTWGFYCLVIPKGWREWTRAGIVQAFIIAFYAEMYGFPVTIYLLARIFNLDVAGDVWDGNLWVYLTGSRWASGTLLSSLELCC